MVGRGGEREGKVERRASSSAAQDAESRREVARARTFDHRPFFDDDDNDEDKGGSWYRASFASSSTMLSVQIHTPPCPSPNHFKPPRRVLQMPRDQQLPLQTRPHPIQHHDQPLDRFPDSLERGDGTVGLDFEVEVGL